MSSQTIEYQHENTSMMTTPDSDYCYQEQHVNKIVERMMITSGAGASGAGGDQTQSQRSNIYIQNNIPVRFHINNYTNISNYDIENVVRSTTNQNQSVFNSRKVRYIFLLDHNKILIIYYYSRLS